MVVLAATAQAVLMAEMAATEETVAETEMAEVVQVVERLERLERLAAIGDSTVQSRPTCKNREPSSQYRAIQAHQYSVGPVEHVAETHVHQDRLCACTVEDFSDEQNRKCH